MSIFAEEMTGANWDRVRDRWRHEHPGYSLTIVFATDPRAALRLFLEANQLEYEGTCGECGGTGWYDSANHINPCPTCSGTGGPPDPLLVAMAADWFEERGMVLRGMQ